MNYNEWKVKNEDGLIVGQVLKFEKGKERNKLVQTALSGVRYIQTIGTPTDYADVDVFCTAEQRDLLNFLEATGSYIQILYKSNRYYGYIDEAPDWNTERPGEYYTASIKFLIDEQEEV